MKPDAKRERAKARQSRAASRRQAKTEAAIVALGRRAVEVSSRAVAPDPWVSATDPWFVVEVETRREDRAEAELHRHGFDAWLPRIEVSLLRLARRVTIERALFPGYLLLSIAGAQWSRVGEVAGLEAVRGLVGSSNGGAPVRLPASFVAELLMRMRSTGGEVVPVSGRIEPGEVVRVVFGPFAGFLAVVERALPGFQRFVVNAEVFGRSTTNYQPVAHIERA